MTDSSWNGVLVRGCGVGSQAGMTWAAMAEEWTGTADGSACSDVRRAAHVHSGVLEDVGVDLGGGEGSFPG
jgi:hypothetical protein